MQGTEGNNNYEEPFPIFEQDNYDYWQEWKLYYGMGRIDAWEEYSKTAL